MTKRRLHSAVILTTSLLAATAPRGRAHAEDAPKAPTAAELSTARALFEKGLAAEDEGRFDEGLALFAQVRAIAVSPAVDYHLGSCHEHLGHLVEALNAFELAAQEAERKGDAAMLAEAHAHIRSLRGRAARLVIEVPQGALGARITLDGAPLHAALAGTPTLVNPGRVRVMVSAENYASPFDAVVSAAAGKDTVVRAELGARRAPDAEPASPGEPSAASAVTAAGGRFAPMAAHGLAPARGLSTAPPAPPAASAPAAPVATEPDAFPETASRVPAIIAGAATVGFGGAAMVTGALAHQDYLAFQRENAAPSPGSFAARQALHDRGRAFAVGSTMLTIAAVVDAGVTVVLIVRSIRRSISPSASRPSAGVRASVVAAPWLGPSSGGVSIWGAL